MALVKTSKRSHGPTTYILEITEAEAREVFLSSDPDSGLHAGLAAVLPALPEDAPVEYDTLDSQAPAEDDAEDDAETEVAP